MDLRFERVNRDGGLLIGDVGGVGSTLPVYCLLHHEVVSSVHHVHVANIACQPTVKLISIRISRKNMVLVHVNNS